VLILNCINFFWSECNITCAVQSVQKLEHLGLQQHPVDVIHCSFWPAHLHRLAVLGSSAGHLGLGHHQLWYISCVARSMPPLLPQTSPPSCTQTRQKYSTYTTASEMLLIIRLIHVKVIYSVALVFWIWGVQVWMGFRGWKTPVGSRSRALVGV